MPSRHAAWTVTDTCPWRYTLYNLPQTWWIMLWAWHTGPAHLTGICSLTLNGFAIVYRLYTVFLSESPWIHRTHNLSHLLRNETISCPGWCLELPCRDRQREDNLDIWVAKSGKAATWHYITKQCLVGFHVWINFGGCPSCFVALLRNKYCIWCY